MMFLTALMADPVMASDGFTYEREFMELWMAGHDTSPTTREPLEHKFLIPNHVMRRQIATWCEQNGVPVPVAPKPADKPAAAGGGAAAAPLLHKPQVTCTTHPKEQLRVFCRDCCHGVCVLCAVDTKRCKAHGTEALDTLIEELQTDREGWARAQEECRSGAEEVCAVIQADADAKKQAIDNEAAALQQQVRAAAEERAAALGTIVHKRQQREELVVGAAASPELAVKGSAAAAVVASALDRPKASISPGSAAEFRAAAAPAAAVGHVLVADAVFDPEDEAARAAAAAAERARAEEATRTQSFCIQHKGYIYRALADAWDPHHADWNSVKDQSKTALPVPLGFEIAPNDADCREVIGAYGWSTHAMVLADGASIWTKCQENVAKRGQNQGSDTLVREGDTFRPSYGSVGILIRKPHG